MNEQKNAELILSLYTAFARGDVQFILDRVTDDVEWVTEGPSSIPYAGRLRGKGEVLVFFKAIAETQSDPKLTTDKVVAQGDTVATAGRYAATVKATGRRADSAIAHFFTVRDGKVSQFLDYFDTAAFADAYAVTAAAAH